MNQVSSLTPSKEPRTERGRRTQRKLLDAAQEEFGERGFHEAAISGITQRAGVALGTFYVYFASKEEIFRELVDHMGRMTRAFLSQEVAGEPDRLSAERKGLEAFIAFARANKALYRIVMEAQFVAPDAHRQYYDIFAKGYRTNLEQAAERGQIRPGDSDIRAWALIGMSVFLGMRYGIWDESLAVSEIGQAFDQLIREGLAP